MGNMTPEHNQLMLEAKINAIPRAEVISKALLTFGRVQRGQIEKRLLEMPGTCKIGYLTAMDGNSKAAAIKAFCLECVGWNRVHVKACTALACPLYSHRPFTGDSDE